MSRSAAMRVARPLLALLAWIAGCEVFIDGKLYLVGCDDEGAVGPPACDEGQECRAGACVEATSRHLGDACGGDGECDTNDLCLDERVFGDQGRSCTRPCCSSSDCDPSSLFVCAAPPGGFGPRFCRPASSVGISKTGGARAGEPCLKPADCRSGRCDPMTGACDDACCSDTGCAQGTGTCRLGGPTGTETGFTCAPPAGMAKLRYQPCKVDIECASGLCVMFPGGDGRCSSPCCGSAGCETADVGGVAMHVACAPVEHGGILIRACSKLVSEKAVLPIGAPCNGSAECRSGQCILPGVCSDACCGDDDCGDPSVFRCRPGPKEAQWALQCEHK